jgi:hypothetical protein
MGGGYLATAAKNQEDLSLPWQEFLLPLSSCGDILSKRSNRLSGSQPVDKAFSVFSTAFLVEKLDANKNCGNHRST